MLSFCDDNYQNICKYISDRDKIRFTMISKSMSRLKHIFIYSKRIHINKIKHLPYYNNFENITIDEECHIPKKAKYIHYVATNMHIPQCVTHVVFFFS